MLVDGSTPGNDMRYIEKKVEAARNFANKLWNATRFVLMNLPEDFEPGLPCEELLDMSDKWVLTKLNQVAGAMTDNLDHFEMGLAAATSRRHRRSSAVANFPPKTSITSTSSRVRSSVLPALLRKVTSICFIEPDLFIINFTLSLGRCLPICS